MSMKMQMGKVKAFSGCDKIRLYIVINSSQEAWL
jgi:hypothetical protein